MSKTRELTTLEKEFIKQKKAYGYKIIIQDNNVILKDDDGEVAVAKCDPNDTFDIKIGFEVAMLKREINKIHEANDIYRAESKKLEKDHKNNIEKNNKRIKRNKKSVNKIKRKIYEMTKGDK